jgi:predicted O-linked N-acetylglucosamine transferase (SPINDLY family)
MQDSPGPDTAYGLVELGLASARARRLGDAEAGFRRALELEPQNLHALANLATVLQATRRPAEAEPLYRRVLAIDPAHVPALLNLGVLLKDAGRAAEARPMFRRAYEQAPALGPAIQAHLALSPVIPSLAAIDAERQAYALGLEALAVEPGDLPYAGERLNLPWYYLAYHGGSGRALAERTAQVLGEKVPGLRFTAPHLASWTADPARRLRIGFCSEFLRGHTIGHLFAGFVRHLDRRRFEVVVIHAAHSLANPMREAIDAAADRAMVLPPGLAEAQAMIAGLALDVLIYPDVGMSAQTWMLAHARLAPVQAVSWGHPDTTGVAALDYFLSCDAIEPKGAEAAYSERLVRMSRLPSCYARPTPPSPADRASLGLPAGGALYGCPQTLFKLHPEFDAVLAAIAEADPDGHIVLIEADNPLHTDVVRGRWAAGYPQLLERVRFLPRLSHDAFLAALASFDVLLDPLHFGSGNTLYEGVAAGAPTVTWPAGFARSRIVAAAYAQMGVPDAPVAASAQEYVRLAVGLGRDPARRRRLSEALRARGAALFDDRLAVRELEAFAEAAVAAAARGERLPAGWRPELEESLS